MAQPLTDAINALTQYANTVTGASDQTLSEAVATLASGYGGGGFSSKGLADGTEPNGVLDLDDCTTIASYAFANKKSFTGCIGNSVTYIQLYAFQSCSGLQSVSFPSLTGCQTGIFQSCTNLTNIYVPNMVTANILAFAQCANLEFLDLPSMTKLNYSGVFRNDYNFQTLILRHSDVVPINNDVFSNTPFSGYGGKTGTVYVPSSLISAYQTASNWSTLFNGGTVTFVAIEGSQYE